MEFVKLRDRIAHRFDVFCKTCNESRKTFSGKRRIFSTIECRNAHIFDVLRWKREIRVSNRRFMGEGLDKRRIVSTFFAKKTSNFVDTLTFSTLKNVYKSSLRKISKKVIENWFTRRLSRNRWSVTMISRKEAWSRFSIHKSRDFFFFLSWADRLVEIGASKMISFEYAMIAEIWLEILKI